MYRVITEFYDLADNNKHYTVGDMYPRDGYKPDKGRIEYLAGDTNLLGTPVIRMDAEKSAGVAEKPKRTRKKA